MNQYIKLINKAKQNPKGLSFSEFHTLMTKCGWVKIGKKVVIRFGTHQKEIGCLFKLLEIWQKNIKFDNF